MDPLGLRAPCFLSVIATSPSNHRRLALIGRDCVNNAYRKGNVEKNMIYFEVIYSLIPM